MVDIFQQSLRRVFILKVSYSKLLLQSTQKKSKLGPTPFLNQIFTLDFGLKVAFTQYNILFLQL